MTVSSMRSRMELGVILNGTAAAQLDRILRVVITMSTPVIRRLPQRITREESGTDSICLLARPPLPDNPVYHVVSKYGQVDKWRHNLAHMKSSKACQRPLIKIHTLAKADFERTEISKSAVLRSDPACRTHAWLLSQSLEPGQIHPGHLLAADHVADVRIGDGERVAYLFCSRVETNRFPRILGVRIHA